MQRVSLLLPLPTLLVLRDDVLLTSRAHALALLLLLWLVINGRSCPEPPTQPPSQGREILILYGELLLHLWL